MENVASSIGTELPKVIAKVRDEILPVYDSTPHGWIAAAMMRKDLDRASEAMITGDTIEMIRVYEDLKGYSL